ncbi:MAG: hypothetical protein KTR32_35455 [Granulosicoccus sp.]|nr:hypothetical protein [Granulosicoccus sp.]
MIDTVKLIVKEIRSNSVRIVLISVVFAVLFQVFQLLALIVRFGAFPNYAVGYDWLANVLRIFQSTPSIRDSLSIVSEEWLLEIGYMNYDYGNGISEWSLNVIPTKLVVLMFVGALIALLFILLRNSQCTLSRTAGGGKLNAAVFAGAGLGTTLVAMTSAAMSWVVCCATPSWVVGLAMMGLGVSTSLALEDKGGIIFFSGLLLLISAVLLAGWTRSRQSKSDVVLPVMQVS